MIKVFRQYEKKEDIYFPIVNCFDIRDNMYEINPDTFIIRRIDTKYIMSQFFDISTGYYKIGLRTYSNTQKCYFVHRIVAKMFCFEYDNKNIVNHINGNKTDNKYSNLEWCTHQENVNHAIRMGLVNNKGTNNYHNILNEQQVHDICRLMSQGLKYSDILNSLNLPINDNMLDILTKIRTKCIWDWISDQYQIPEPEYRSPQTIYSDEQLHEISKMIAYGNSNRDIAINLGLDLKNKKQMDKFYKFIGRIRRRETYTHITKYYNW